MKGVVLLIFDGMGISLPSPSNAYFQSHPQHFDEAFHSYPHTQLKASEKLLDFLQMNLEAQKLVI